MLSGSAALAWPSSAITQLVSNDTDVNPLSKPITTIDISTMVSLPILLGLLGCLSAPYVTGRLGRKRLLLFNGFVMFLTTVCMAFGRSIFLIIACRCMFFVCFIGSLSIIPVYVTEMCENHNRAKFCSLTAIFMPVGQLMSYLIGANLSYKPFTLASSVPLAVFLVLFGFTTETPEYLLAIGRRSDCFKALRKLRSNKDTKEIIFDFEQIENNLKMKASAKKTGLLALLKDRNARLGIVLALIPSILHHFCGDSAISTFLGPIFQSAGTNISIGLATAIVGVVKIFSLGISSFIVERKGRVFLLLSSALGCALFFTLIGLYFYLKKMGSSIVNDIRWLPLVGVVGYVVAFSVGLGPLPNTIMGELFSTDHRPIAVSIIIAVVTVFLFGLNFLFPLVTEYAGMHFSMWMFAFNSLFGAFCIYLFLPETAGKSISENQNVLTNYRIKLKRW
uniref:Major facilitator superfamily protein n=1 Tax=Phyllotreta armoraciae TaxID=1553667 RepID=A0A858Z6T8_9CUCU|nr:major facilitator superfamily protein [Phyllotreta armoraciae]